MNKKLVKEFLIITFIYTYFIWGLCIFITKYSNVNVNDNIFASALFLLGGLGPCISSFVSLKKNKEIKGFKDWFKMIFKSNLNIKSYLCVLLFIFIYFLVGILVNGYTKGYPFSELIILIPYTLIISLLEEVGWRMILNREFEKKYSFYVSTLLVGIIWWLWHAPLFLINGTTNSTMNYLYFGIMCWSLSISLYLVSKLDNGIIPAIILHGLINAISGLIVFDFSLLSCCITLIITTIVSMLILYFNKRHSR